MTMNAQKLAMRDPAMVALLLGSAGLVAGDFGAESDFGTEFAAEFGLDEDFDSDYGSEDFGAEFAAEFGSDFGAAAAVATARPTPSAALAAWRSQMAKKVNTAKRARILEPNKGSAAKIERYSFTMSEDIELGTASTFTDLSDQPDTQIRPQVITCNAPTPMFAFISNIKLANVSVTVGSGEEDAYNYNSNGYGRQLDMPTLSPSNRATVTGRYTGYLPPGFVGGTTVPFMVNFKGPASIVA